MKLILGAALLLSLSVVSVAAVHTTSSPTISIHGVYNVSSPSFENDAPPMACGTRFYIFPGQGTSHITAVDVKTLSNIYTIPTPTSYNEPYQHLTCTDVDGYVIYTADQDSLPPGPPQRVLLSPNGTALVGLNHEFITFGQYIVLDDGSVFNVTTGANITTSTPATIAQGKPLVNKGTCVTKSGKKHCQDSNRQEEKVVSYAYSPYDPHKNRPYTSITLTNYETLQVVAQFNEVFPNAPLSGPKNTYLGSDPYFYYLISPSSLDTAIFAWNKTDSATGLPKTNFSAPADVKFVLPSGHFFSGEQPACNGKLVGVASVNVHGGKFLTSFTMTGGGVGNSIQIGSDVDAPNYYPPSIGGPSRNTWTVWNTTEPTITGGNAPLAIQIYSYPWDGSNVQPSKIHSALNGLPGNNERIGFSLGPKSGLFVGDGHMPGQGSYKKKNFLVWDVNPGGQWSTSTLPNLVYTSEQFYFSAQAGVVPGLPMFWFVTKIEGSDQLAAQVTFFKWQ